MQFQESGFCKSCTCTMQWISLRNILSITWEYPRVKFGPFALAQRDKCHSCNRKSFFSTARVGTTLCLQTIPRIMMLSSSRSCGKSPVAEPSMYVLYVVTHEKGGSFVEVGTATGCPTRMVSRLNSLGRSFVAFLLQLMHFGKR